MTDFWLPHLTFSVLAFLLVARVGRSRPLQASKLFGCLLLSLVPLEGMSLALHLRTYAGDVSISSLVLLGCLALGRFGLAPAGAQDRLAGLALFACLALILYPATLGLSYIDPYQLGYQPRPMLLVIGLLSLVLIVQRFWITALALVLATLAFTLRLNASENYWDYLIDPYLALYSLGALLATGGRRLRARQAYALSSETRNLA